MSVFRDAWNCYTPLQRRNIAVYIGGIMCYKFGLEFFNGSITTLATDRFNAENAFTKLGAAQGLNQAMQCVGAILIAPLAARYPTKNVLSFAGVMFGLMTTILLIVDAATGGKIRQPGGRVTYGNWNPNAIFPIWAIAGIAYGMVELIRRVIPADICGGHVLRLRRMDATVHILYEVAGTSGAFASSAAISRFGNNYSYMLSPIFFAMAGGIWYFIIPSAVNTGKGRVQKQNQTLGDGQDNESHGAAGRGDAALEAVEVPQRRGYFSAVALGSYHFIKSVYVGGKLIFTHRKFCWLFTSYSLALYLHRFLESSLAPAFARRVLGTSAWSQIMVGGSNFGELLGAVFVFLLATKVPTPIPWLRLDATMLNLVWVLPHFSTIATRQVRWAWYIAALYIPISFGWAAGDVSLAAYIQSSLSDMDIHETGISPLGAVMSFLYSGYIVLNAVLSSVLGSVIDADIRATGTITNALTNVAGIQFSVCCAIIWASTFIPRGSWAINPKQSGDLATEGGDDDDDTMSPLDGAVLKEGGQLGSPTLKDQGQGSVVDGNELYKKHNGSSSDNDNDDIESKNVPSSPEYRQRTDL